MWSRLSVKKVLNSGVYDLRFLKPPSRNARFAPKNIASARRRRSAADPTIDNQTPESDDRQVQNFINTLPSEQRNTLKRSINDGVVDPAQLLPYISQERPTISEDDIPSAGDTYDMGVKLVKAYMHHSLVFENPRKHHKDLWKVVEYLGELVPEREEQIPLELFGQLFEIAKLQPMPNIRPKCVKLIGDIIYSFETIRMDPFNEVEYMDSLCISGNTYRAIELWKSRRSKDDVKDSLYWLEVGALYYQQARNFSNSETLALEISDKFDQYVPPRVVAGLLMAYSRLKQTDKIEFWYTRLQDLLKRYGVERTGKENNSDTQNIDQEQAQNMFNEPKPFKDSELQDLVKGFLDARTWEYAARLIDDMKNMNIDISLDSVLATLDATTRRMVEYEPAAYTGRRRKHGPAADSNKKLTVVISKLVAQYPQLLDNPKFYESWLRGLAGLELYRNALMVVDAMVNRGISPSVTHMHTLIKALLAKNQLDIALDLLERMEGRTSDSLYPPISSTIYALFIQYGARRSDSAFVEKMLARMIEHGCQQSQSSFNTLMFYYYRHHQFARVFDLYNTTLLQNGFQFFDHINYRTLWLICRDYYRCSHLADRHVAIPTSPPDMRTFFKAMIHSPKFKLCLNVYEYVLHAFMLSRDYEAVAAVLCHLDTVNNIKIQGPLIGSMIQLAHKMKDKRKFAFTRPTKKDLLVEPGYSDPKSESMSWDNVVRSMAPILDIKGEDIENLVKEGSRLCNEFNDDNPLQTN